MIARIPTRLTSTAILITVVLISPPQRGGAQDKAAPPASEALPAGGRFSGHWYGPRDSWAGRSGMTFVSRDEALALLDGFELEMFEEEEADGTTPRGNAKHWHIFHIVARKF